VNQDSLVSKMTGYALKPQAGGEILRLLCIIQNGSEGYWTNYSWVPGLFPWEWSSQGMKAGHLSTSSAKINKSVKFYFHSPIYFHDMVLNHWDILLFTYQRNIHMFIS
jgi:hypothetical protein